MARLRVVLPPRLGRWVEVAKARIPTEESFDRRLRSTAMAARVGLWLGGCFVVAFVTGVISHYAQADAQPLGWSPSPAWGYQLNQALHTITGIAAIPLLIIKLWTVFPKLFQPLPTTVASTLLTIAERGSIAVLIGSSFVQLVIGVMNVAQWYLWPFDFKRVHFALAFVIIGSLAVHIAVKLPVIRSALGAPLDAGPPDPAPQDPGQAEPAEDEPAEDEPVEAEPVEDEPADTEPVEDGPVEAGPAEDGPAEDGPAEDDAGQLAAPLLNRRMLLTTTGVAVAVAVVATSPPTGTLPGLSRIAALSPRSLAKGIPINRTAAEAGVSELAQSPAYRCRVVGGPRPADFSREELAALPQRTCRLPIACVEGWTAYGSWTGVSLRDLLDQAGVPAEVAVRIRSLQRGSSESVTEMPSSVVNDPRTLVALHLNGAELSLDHGYPARIIAPNRPGALQTKWVAHIEVA